MDNKADEIIRGIYNRLIRNEDVEKIAKIRKDICVKCPEYQEKPIERCKKCGCVLSIKTRSIKSECPLKKWMQIRD